jgi:hypothetical protein
MEITQVGTSQAHFVFSVGSCNDSGVWIMNDTGKAVFLSCAHLRQGFGGQARVIGRAASISP